MRALALLIALLFALLPVADASADGDPASDFLVSQDIFTPYPAPSAGASQMLANAVQAVVANNDRVKVAVIAGPSDLGSVSSLYGHPQDYAQFLGAELAFIYEGPLLIVMPSGFGFARVGKPVPAAAAVLARVSLDRRGADGLTLSAGRALPALEHANLLTYRDSVAPQVFPLATKVIAGRRVALRYEVWDDSGRASVDLRVENARFATIARYKLPLRNVVQGTWYQVVWRAPLKLAHTVAAVCVRATDPAGNRSRSACAKLTIA